MAGRFHDERECWSVAPDIVDSPQRRYGTMAEPPPDPYAWSAVSSVSARATSESTFRCSSTPASPAPIVSTAAWVAPAVRQLWARETNPFNSPAQFSLGSKPIVAGSRPASVAACATTRAAGLEFRVRATHLGEPPVS